eukprot:5831565-Ditylum_brightwellii.AAC.1
MANSKSPGLMGVTLGAFCAMVWCEADPAQAGLNVDAEYLCQYITDILNLFLGGELDIEAWRTGNLSPVPKPGDLSDPNKWRPVCLLKTLYKILASILAYWINPLAVLESLELVWKQEQIPVPIFRWFPTSKNGWINSCIQKQGKAMGKEFEFEKSLYVDNGAF